MILLELFFYTINEDSQVQSLQSATVLDFVWSFPFAKMIWVQDQEPERKLRGNKIYLINNLNNHQ